MGDSGGASPAKEHRDQSRPCFLYFLVQYQRDSGVSYTHLYDRKVFPPELFLCSLWPGSEALEARRKTYQCQPQTGGEYWKRKKEERILPDNYTQALRRMLALRTY